MFLNRPTLSSKMLCHIAVCGVHALERKKTTCSNAVVENHFRFIKCNRDFGNRVVCSQFIAQRFEMTKKNVCRLVCSYNF